MTQNEFVLLPQIEQTNVLKQATKMAERVDGKYKFELFEYGNFYIESRYSLLFNTLSAIKASDDSDMLDPYLVEMHLSDFQE